MELSFDEDESIGPMRMRAAEFFPVNNVETELLSEETEQDVHSSVSDDVQSSRRNSSRTWILPSHFCDYEVETEANMD